MSLDPRRAAEELARREAARQRATSVTSAIRAELFDKQLAFIDDPARNKAALCTRRAGKTSMWARYCTIVALENPGCIIRIWAINRLRAKQLLWNEFLFVAKRHKQDENLKAHGTELTLTFENGSEIRLLGADKDKEAQKKRGDKTRMEVVLEAQLFGPFLRTLVEDVAAPCLFDHKGTLCLEGTPGPVPTGYWYYVTGDESASEMSRWNSTGMPVSTGEKDERGNDIKELVGKGWSCHRWSLLDNPFMPRWVGMVDWRKQAIAAVKEEMQSKGWTAESTTYRREYLGKWVRDDGVLFYKYNSVRNDYSLVNVQPWGEGWTHVLGWDLGSRDDMALGVWGWHPSRRELYQAAEWKKPGASAEEVTEQIEKWERQGFNFIAKVADTGGGGLMYVEQVMRRTSHVFVAAKKSEKLEHVRLMNDDFISGRIKVQAGSEYVTELSSLPKDPNWEPESGLPPGEDPRFPNHLCDCFLYAWRHALNHVDFSPVGETESLGDRMERIDEEQLGQTQTGDWWDEEYNEDL